MPRPDPTPLTEIATWPDALEALHARIAPHFVRPEVRDRVGRYLAALLGPVERRNGWQVAEQLGERTPDGVQRLLTTARWDADTVRDDLRRYVVEHFGDAQAVLVLDETGFLKKGTKSVGVQRQYSGTAGRIDNCQLGVFLAYAGARGSAFLDRALYLPQSWTTDPDRRREAGVPEAVTFQTKPQLACTMLARALDAGVPAGWVTADEVYGGDRRLRLWLEARDMAHVLAVKRTEPLVTWTERGPAQVSAADLVAACPAAAWTRLSCGDGAKGPRRYDWVRVAIRPLSDPERGYWVLARQSVSDPTARAYYVCYGPAGTTLADLVAVAGRRWVIEAGFERAKGEVGLDQYEVRRWEAWHRHVTLGLLADAYLAVTRAAAAEAEAEAEKGGPLT